MRLAQYQQSLERALRGVATDADAYLASVRTTREWRLLQHSVHFWRLIAVQRGAPLTATLLLEHGRLHDVVDGMLADRVASPYPETMAESFLKRVVSVGDAVEAALARSELALQRVARGDDTTYVVEWPADPLSLLASVLDPERRPGREQPGQWRLTISRFLPNYFATSRLDDQKYPA